jgi:hypothetical protein
MSRTHDSLMAVCHSLQRKAYQLLTKEPQEDRNAAFIWLSRVPNRFKVFAWLAFKGRQNTMANHAHKTITTNSDCQRCLHQEEDTDHRFIGCTYATRIWQCLGFGPHYSSLHLLWDAPAPTGLNDSVRPFVLMAIEFMLQPTHPKVRTDGERRAIYFNTPRHV